MNVNKQTKTSLVMRKLPRLCSVNYSTRIFLKLFFFLILCSAFLGSSIVSGQQAQTRDTLSELKFIAQPQHRIAIMEEDNRVQETNVNAATFQLAENQNFAVIEADIPVRKLSPSNKIPGILDMTGDKYLLPFNLLARLTDNSTVELGVILINSTAMEIDEAGQQFNGKLVFRLLNRNNPTLPAEDLESPVFFEVYSQKLDLINPERIEFTRTNSSSPEISCGGDKGLVDSVDLKVVTDFKPEGYVFHLDIEPYLEIKSAKNTILGMGIEEPKMTLLLQGTTMNDSIAVSLDASLGTVIPNEIMMYSDIPGQFKVRSAGLGETVISAHAPNIKTIEKSFIYVFPWLFIAMALIGGILGTLAKTYIGTPGKLTLKNLGLGAVFGLIGAVAWYGLGVNLLSFELSPILHEFGALGIGALIALLGIRTIEN